MSWLLWRLQGLSFLTAVRRLCSVQGHDCTETAKLTCLQGPGSKTWGSWSYKAGETSSILQTCVVTFTFVSQENGLYHVDPSHHDPGICHPETRSNCKTLLSMVQVHRGVAQYTT